MCSSGRASPGNIRSGMSRSRQFWIRPLSHRGRSPGFIYGFEALAIVHSFHFCRYPVPVLYHAYADPDPGGTKTYGSFPTDPDPHYWFTLYRKSLRVASCARKDTTSGEIVNLMAVDCQRIADLMPYINMIWSSPLQIGVSIIMLYQILGPSVFAGKYHAFSISIL